MKSLLGIVFLLNTVFGNFQQKSSFLIDKTFSTQIGTMCEEVDGDSSCAGQTIFLLLKFEKTSLLAKKKYVSSCGKISEIPIGNFAWTQSINKLLLEKTEHTFLDNLELFMANNILLGKIKNNENNRNIDYRFKEI